MRNFQRLTMVSCLVLLTALAGAQAASVRGADEDPYRTSVQVRIALPDGSTPKVALEPGGQTISLELPAGSEFPVDFVGVTGGLVREATVTPLGTARVRLDLELALGLLHEVVYTPEGVTLRFQSRFDVQQATDQDEDDDNYRLGPDDEILLTVHGHEDLTSERRVTDAGYILAPLVGEVKAEGLTPRQLASRLAELLGRDYLVDPQVDVEVEKFESQWVMIAGEVRVPGRVPLRGGTRLKEVLSEAGGFGSDSGEKITITRNSGDTDEVSVAIDRTDFEDGVENPMLRHGDIVTISKAKYAFFQGEVGAPGRVRIERGLTLLKAIAQVGGLTDWANRKQIQIMPAEGGTPQVYNLKSIQNGRQPDPQLMGGEIVIVKRRFF